MEKFTRALTLCPKMETLICKGFETGNGRDGAGPLNSPLGELGGQLQGLMACLRRHAARVQIAPSAVAEKFVDILGYPRIYPRIS